MTKYFFINNEGKKTLARTSKRNDFKYILLYNNDVRALRKDKESLIKEQRYILKNFYGYNEENFEIQEVIKEES